MKKCPFCAEEILDEAIKCKHCGSMLKAETKSQGTTKEITIPTYKTPRLLEPSFLNQDELVYFELKPIRGMCFAGTMAATVFTVGVAYLSTDTGVTIFMVAVTLITAIVNHFQWKNIIYAITNKRVIVIRGLINKLIKQAPLEKIQNFEMQTTPFNRNFGHIAFDTAGGIYQEIVWKYINHPEAYNLGISKILNK